MRNRLAVVALAAATRWRFFLYWRWDLLFSPVGAPRTRCTGTVRFVCWAVSASVVDVEQCPKRRGGDGGHRHRARARGGGARRLCQRPCCGGAVFLHCLVPACQMETIWLIPLVGFLNPAVTTYVQLQMQCNASSSLARGLTDWLFLYDDWWCCQMSESIWRCLLACSLYVVGSFTSTDGKVAMPWPPDQSSIIKRASSRIPC